MRIAVVLRAIVAVVGVVGVVGCGSTVDGAPTTTGMKTGDVAFNPCTDLSGEVLTATGVDPDTKHVTTDPAGASAWRICSWDAISLPYMLVVASSTHTVDELRSNPKETGLRDVTIGARTGVVHHDVTDPEVEVCRVALPAQQGMFVISAAWRASQPITADRCDLAVKHARDLNGHLPK
ncbi:DUF3558 domain-containing protein [Nocardia farcinica]|uniref:DUF3558 domain-containing protein n=1 Tax=Nocardia farcinica TaxID=37329 RepID=UPI001895F6FD|nr:DUF3558 domain-containing protein [Nocardia farcinica]MBF6140368.1 DUF3558 domain-containing protein [Nocardia farcinica]MBF6259082.1 DUF3558 domain-containing protein [Nocardia farcinica]MBF6361639.1 DUF3558 domain-containing protein [Nocardia farcinica]MBF6385837.1 DUF3558 domain-containing protein [Nocardia farcinica]MBF6420783.1 DUF3558 domain-containing protein [Nocardia farcinica]